MLPGYVPTGETEPKPEMWTPERDGSTFIEDGRIFFEGEWYDPDGEEHHTYDALAEVPGLKVNE